jgi:RNA polymerase sigma-32 factor
MVKLGTTQAQRTLFYQLGRERERLRRLGVDADNSAIAKSLSLKESEVDEMAQRLAGGDLSLEAPRGEGEDLTLLDALPSADRGAEALVGDAQSRAIYLEKLEGFVAGLSERERKIFKARWMREDPRTLQEVGEELGITRERVRQLEARLLKNLRAYLEAEGVVGADFFD